MKESKLVRGTIAILAVLAFSVPAIASAGGEQLVGKSEKVSYADLNIDKDSGAQALYRRLQQASKRVCGVESIKISGSVRAVMEQQRCYRNALDEAVAKIDNTALTEVHES